MRMRSPIPKKHARIEIIPLIDIMFFLLASFLLASLSMMRLQSIKMDLPTAVTSQRDFKRHSARGPRRDGRAGALLS